MILGRAAKVCPCFYAIKKEKMKNNLELKEIINGMIAETGRPMSAEDIYKSMTDNGGEIQIEEIKLALKELSRDGRVIITRRGKAALPEQLGRYIRPHTGQRPRLRLLYTRRRQRRPVHRCGGYERRLTRGYCVGEELTGSPRGRNDRGAVEMIARRAGGRVIGTFEADTSTAVTWYPTTAGWQRMCSYPFPIPTGANHGDKVVAEITQYPGARRPMLGKIAEVLGRPGDKGIDMLSIIRRLELLINSPMGRRGRPRG